MLLHVVIDNTSRYFLDADGEAFAKELEVGSRVERILKYASCPVIVLND
jgi:hypothetical protein